MAWGFQSRVGTSKSTPHGTSEAAEALIVNAIRRESALSTPVLRPGVLRLHTRDQAVCFSVDRYERYLDNYLFFPGPTHP